MKIRKITIAAFAIMLLLALSGCQLALEDAGPRNEDRLIGIFVTNEYLDLFDFEGYLNDNINKISKSGDIAIEDYIRQHDGNNPYQGRLYASLVSQTLTSEDGSKVDDREFVFDNIDGISYFSAKVTIDDEHSYYTNGSDEAISDSHIAISNRDNEDKTSLDGTIYVSSSDLANKVFYINPVYQSDDGSVYAVSGISGSIGGEYGGEGQIFSQTIDSTITVTENGKPKSISSSVKISIATMYPPEKIVVRQMDADSNTLSKKGYNPGELPSVIWPDKDTAYIIIESYKHDYEGASVVTRSIVDNSDNIMETFYTRDDGICIKQWTELDWNR